MALGSLSVWMLKLVPTSAILLNRSDMRILVVKLLHAIP